MAKKVQKRKLRRHLDELDLPQGAKLRAIAVKYELGKDKVPKIVASGKGRVAGEILKLAEEHHVPFYEDPTLTQLLSKLQVNDEIPGEMYTIIAEVLAWVYQLDKLAKKRKGVKRNVQKTSR